MKKFFGFVLSILVVVLCVCNSSVVYAEELGDFEFSNLSIPELSENILAEDVVWNNIKDEIIVDETKNALDISSYINRRSGYVLSDNPNVGIDGTLTLDNNMDMYFFNVSAGNKFMLARLNSSNSNYVAQLYIVDENAGSAAPTNIYGFAGDLIQLNGLPEGSYLFLVFANDDSYGQDYRLDINATNPSANLSAVNYLKNDLSIFVFRTVAGDVYSNGHLLYNVSSSINTNLNWSRVNEFSWGSGYEQRTHSVFNVKVKAMSSPVSYSSTYASSSCAVLLYCDKDTAFSYLHTYYQSGVDHIYQSSTTDTTGRTTPRALDDMDFLGGNEHILVVDLASGQVIDFYSTLNIYYANGYEAQPVINFL